MKFGLVLALLIAAPCWSQTRATGKAETTGPCSPLVTGSNNQVTINCKGVGKDQGAELLKIVNKILANRLDSRAVLSKLDEIIANQKMEAVAIDKRERTRSNGYVVPAQQVNPEQHTDRHDNTHRRTLFLPRHH